MHKLKIIEGGNQHNQKGNDALAALLHGNDARFQEILLTMPSPPRLNVVHDAEPTLRSAPTLPDQSS